MQKTSLYSFIASSILWLLVKVFNLGAMGVWLSFPISDILSSLASYMLIRNEGIELNLAVKKQLEKEKISKGLILN